MESTEVLTQEAGESQTKVSSRGIPGKEKKKHLEWAITKRFVEEVEVCEAEGRVESRQKLEKDLLITPGGVTAMRAGKNNVSLASLRLIKERYNGDLTYIIMGVRDPLHSGTIQGGVKLNKHTPYKHKYRDGDYKRAHKPSKFFAVPKSSSLPAPTGQE